MYKNKYLKYKYKYIKNKKNLEQTGGKKTNLISITNTKKILSNINKNIKSFGIFPINYTPDDIDFINTIQIQKTKQFNYYGTIKNFLDCIDLKNYLEAIILINTGTGTGTCTSTNQNLNQIDRFAEIITNITKSMSNVYKKKYIWLTIRTVLPNDQFVIPRWHCDGYFYKKDINNPTDSDIDTKFITVFNGPGTILIDPDEKTRTKYFQFIEQSFKDLELEKITDSTDFKKYIEHQNKIRPDLDNILKSSEKINISNQQGLIFKSGSKDICAIHSEPNITKSRIFMSIIFGTSHQIKEFELRNQKQKK